MTLRGIGQMLGLCLWVLCLSLEAKAQDLEAKTGAIAQARYVADPQGVALTHMLATAVSGASEGESPPPLPWPIGCQWKCPTAGGKPGPIRAEACGIRQRFIFQSQRKRPGRCTCPA